MRKIKFPAVFAAIGFILSFVFGFFSHSSFILIFLKALIFGVVFGALGFGIQILYDKFLNESSESSYVSEPVSQGAPQSQKGQLVDITIQDEELKESETGNHFVVGSNRQMLNTRDLKDSPPVSEENQTSPAKVQTAGGDSGEVLGGMKNDGEQNAENVISANVQAAGADSPKASDSGFIPVRNLETITSVSGKESVKPSEVPVVEGNEGNPSESELDVLPDMDGFSFGGGNDENDDADAETDSEFVPLHKRSEQDPPADIKDAELMAKAISDVLTREDG